MTENHDASTELTDEAAAAGKTGEATQADQSEQVAGQQDAVEQDAAQQGDEVLGGGDTGWRPGGDVPASVAAQHSDPAEVDEVVADAQPGAEADSAVAEVVDADEAAAEVGDAEELAEGVGELPGTAEVVIDDVTMRRALEAILMVTDEPLPVLTLARAVGRPPNDVATALAVLSDEYTEQGRGFDLREVAGGWRYYTREDSAIYVERFVLDGQQSRLTQAALETLAVVAYKQPVSRARVSAIRGVNVDGVMRTLVTRGLVEEAGADTESQATLYRTSSYFLERMGMQSLDDLPELAPYLPEMDDVEDEMAAQDKAAQDKLDGLDAAAAAETEAASGGTAEGGTATEPEGPGREMSDPESAVSEAAGDEEAEAEAAVSEITKTEPGEPGGPAVPAEDVPGAEADEAETDERAAAAVPVEDAQAVEDLETVDDLEVAEDLQTGEDVRADEAMAAVEELEAAEAEDAKAAELAEAEEAAEDAEESGSGDVLEDREGFQSAAGFEAAEEFGSPAAENTISESVDASEAGTAEEVADVAAGGTERDEQSASGDAEAGSGAADVGERGSAWSNRVDD
ncbi:SMC-Scp complex subunit ScpB [Kribbella deserti]|uniref:SMC-Scp complex subunit ScpB n=1 Tax=Kribbella deserti TaxID=1926257 RepID=A0ABV6QL06_9ACTN